MPLIRSLTSGRWMVVASALLVAVSTLVPLDQIAQGDPVCVVCGELGGLDAILNMILFIPLGAALALGRVGWLRAIGLALVLSASVEVLQYFVVPGRDATVRDVVTNGLGGAVGYAIATHWKKFIEPDHRSALLLLLAYGVCWLAFQTLVVYALQLSVPYGAYHGQIARPRAGEIRFSGRVLSAHLGSVAIRDWELPADSIRAALRALPAARFRAIVAGWSECPGRAAPMVRIAAGDRGYAISLAQRRRDAVLSFRSGAHDLGLRPLRYRLRDVFGVGECNHERDTLLFEAQLHPSHITLRADGAGADQVRRVPRRLSDGWRLFTPWTVHIDDSVAERFVSFLWTALPLIPMGYWAARLLFARGKGDPQQLRQLPKP